MQVILFRKLAIRTIDLERVRFAAIESGRKWYNRAMGTASKKHEAVMELTHEEQCALQVPWLAASELTDSCVLTALYPLVLSSAVLLLHSYLRSLVPCVGCVECQYWLPCAD